MTRRVTRGILLGIALAISASAPAQAAVHDINGRDSLDWDRPYVAVEPGDTVRWSFDGTQQAHNVQPEDGASWMPASPLGAPAPPWEHVFETEGNYNFVCVVHPTTMRGTIEVTRTPAAPQAPPPPPPLSAQPLINDATNPPPADQGRRRPRAAGTHRSARAPRHPWRRTPLPGIGAFGGDDHRQPRQPDRDAR